jgi:hypothetical protein
MLPAATFLLFDFHSFDVKILFRFCGFAIVIRD